jgi:predicted RNA polymerase sigma factor
VLGLLALMLLHDARRVARFDGQDLVLLPDQGRSRWDWRQIGEARDLLNRALLYPARGTIPWDSSARPAVLVAGGAHQAAR